MWRRLSSHLATQDIKPLYRAAGVGGRHSVLIMTDKEIKDESFLEYLNIFLNTGELPNLFPRDEYDAIIGDIAVEYTKIHPPKGDEEPAAEELWHFFIERVRNFLHLVLCFSPVGDKFRSRAQKFPAVRTLPAATTPSHIHPSPHTPHATCEPAVPTLRASRR